MGVVFFGVGVFGDFLGFYYKDFNGICKNILNLWRDYWGIGEEMKVGGYVDLILWILGGML